MTGSPDKRRVVIVGGGIAGVEALLAIRDLAGDRAELAMVDPRPDFVYKPLSVEEPFSGEPAKGHELAPILDEVGGRFVLAAATGVRAKEHRLDLADGSHLPYEFLVVCLGARPGPPFSRGHTLGEGGRLDVDGILTRAAEHSSKTVIVVIPPGASWPLPGYELALMTRRRSTELGLSGLRVELATPEQAPLGMFGRTASDAVAELLRARRVELRPSLSLVEDADGRIIGHPGGEPIDAGGVIALPTLVGPDLAGLPADEGGFIPIDLHARVAGIEDVYAAGDGTNFPIKQGGLATQQADAAAEQIAASLGAEREPRPFHPVLRGQLLTGDESLHMSHDLTGGHGEGFASPDQLWWPPHKVSGRYLSPFLEHAGGGGKEEAEPPRRPLSVEVSLPHEWHEQPMTLDRLSEVDGVEASDANGGE